MLFNLVLDLEIDENDKRYPKHERYRSFFYLKDFIESGKMSPDELWEKVKNVFYTLEGFYNDIKIYNIIGYLRNCRGSSNLVDIFRRYEKSDDKNDFKSKLIGLCRKKIMGSGDTTISNSLDAWYFSQVRYDLNQDYAYNFLFLFNIATLNNLRDGIESRFNFHEYNNNNWNIEQIHAQNPKNGERIDDSMELKNLTLLTGGVNKAIGNDTFDGKRRRIIDKFKNGHFVPQCSMNVYMKFYSAQQCRMDEWNDDDRKEYLTRMKEEIEKFLKGE